MSFDSQIVQDLIPGTGSLGSVPQYHDFKRQVLRYAPKRFTADILPPRKFGGSQCYGLRVLPVPESSSATSSASSTKSGASNTEYEVWRRWEDCLWFQDMLETEYKLMARTKRIRLQQGKGVKKDGMYQQSGGAASFDSLPPGPDANDIAKDVHGILPRLTKKGTLFRASQATIDQRSREFTALIHAFFGEDVPTLVKDLRENRIIRDFFGYWRRDKDHDRKAMEVEARANKSTRGSVTSSAFSMYFSASNISLQLPNAFSDVPPSPVVSESVKHKVNGKGKEKGKASARSIAKSASFSSSSSASSRGDPQTPASAPAGMSFTVSESGALIPTSPTSEEDSDFHAFSGSRSAPIRHSPRRSRKSKADRTFPAYGLDSTSESEDNAVHFVPDGPWSAPLNNDIHRRRNLEALPEEQELIPGMADISLARHEGLPPPTRRPRNYSCPDPHNRNGLVFVTPPEPTRSIPDPHEEVSMFDSFHGDSSFLSDRPAPDTPITYSTSSRHTSMALSNFSGEFSRRSSWRTSVDSATSAPVHETNQDTSVDLDDVLCGSSPPSRGFATHAYSEMMHKKRMSIMTMNSVVSNASVDAVLPRRPLSPISSVRRSMSTGSRYSRQSMPASPTFARDETFFEGEGVVEDELLDAYFYDPGLRPSSTQSVAHAETPAKDTDSVLLTRFPQPPQSAPVKRISEVPSIPSSPRPSVSSLSSFTPGSPSLFNDSITIKAVLQESIVLIRASQSTSLSDLRIKIREKFASQEEMQLTDNFTIGFNPAITAAEDRSRTLPAKGRPRSQSTSAMGYLGNQPLLRFLIYEEDWQQATACSPGKLTLHIFDRF